jgi:hypothetical protein
MPVANVRAVRNQRSSATPQSAPCSLIRPARHRWRERSGTLSSLLTLRPHRKPTVEGSYAQRSSRTLAVAAIALVVPASPTHAAYSCSGCAYETNYVDPAFVPVTNAAQPNYRYVSVIDPRACNPLERGHVESRLVRFSNDVYRARASIPRRHVRRHSPDTE